MKYNVISFLSNFRKFTLYPDKYNAVIIGARKDLAFGPYTKFLDGMTYQKYW